MSQDLQSVRVVGDETLQPRGHVFERPEPLCVAHLPSAVLHLTTR